MISQQRYSDVMTKTVKGFPGLYHEDYGKQGTRFRILIHHNKQITQEYFYFGTNQTMARAKKEAIARWRELREVYPVVTKRRFREIPRNVSSTGIPGVTHIFTTVKDKEYEFWKATWTTRKGQKCSRQFSVNKYGVRKAKKLAIEARKAALDAIGPS
jgi:hypothetical protein